MHNADFLKIYLSMFVSQLPILIVCLEAVVVILAKWRHAARGAPWALAGFGFGLFLCIAMPLVHAAVQRWFVQSGAAASRDWVFAAVGIVSAGLYAAVYALLLAAVLAGRPAPSAAARPPQRPR